MNRFLIPTTTPSYVSTAFDEQFSTFHDRGFGRAVCRRGLSRQLFPSEDVLLAETAQGGDCRVSIKTDQHAPTSFDAFVITYP